MRLTHSYVIRMGNSTRVLLLYLYIYWLVGVIVSAGAIFDVVEAMSRFQVDVNLCASREREREPLFSCVSSLSPPAHRADIFSAPSFSPISLCVLGLCSPLQFNVPLIEIAISALRNFFGCEFVAPGPGAAGGNTWCAVCFLYILYSAHSVPH